jgi:DNA-binding transcriptional LysR family regulator
LIDEANMTQAAQRPGLTQSAASIALFRARVDFGDPLLQAG